MRLGIRGELTGGIPQGHPRTSLWGAVGYVFFTKQLMVVLHTRADKGRKCLGNSGTCLLSKDG